MVSDLLVHDGLGVGWLVAFVVTELAVANEVNHKVLAELLAVSVGEPRRRQARLRVVSVDVDHRDLKPLRKVARVQRRARVVPLGGETELIIGDDVYRATGPVAGQ